MCAEGHRVLARLWQGDRPWKWATLCYGRSQPNSRFVLGAGPWRYQLIRLHLTPIHFERWNNSTEIGLCLGRRTLYVLKHR